MLIPLNLEREEGGRKGKVDTFNVVYMEVPQRFWKDKGWYILCHSSTFKGNERLWKESRGSYFVTGNNKVLKKRRYIKRDVFLPIPRNF